MKQIVLGTAGHIDHGKTSLIKALTGIDTDRLKEEKERGITIELGFAHLELPGGKILGIVDVPGHEKFVKNMVAGATGIDLVAMVIAADEGIMPQTREHLEICELLKINKGLVVLTKVDMVDSDWLELVKEEVGSYLKDTFLNNSPVVEVSSVTGEGLDNLLKTLDNIVCEISSKDIGNFFRIPVDRVFTMKGFGTVITGTTISGKISTGDEVTIYPQGIDAKIRGLQVHNHEVNEVNAGNRTAVNLQGVEKAVIQRGNVIAGKGSLRTTYMVDVFLDLLSSSPKKLVNRARVRFHTGTAEIISRVVLLDRDELNPGESCFAQIRLDEPTTVLRKDRFVLRSYSPVRTIGGGEIINALPVKKKRFSKNALFEATALYSGNLDEVIEVFAFASRFKGVSQNELAFLTNTGKKKLDEILKILKSTKKLIQYDKEESILIHKDFLSKAKKEVFGIINEYHENFPLKAGLLKEELRSRTVGSKNIKLFNYLMKHLEQEETIVLEKEFVRLKTHKVTLAGDHIKIRHELEDVFLKSGLQPPYFKELKKKYPGNTADDVLQVLIEEGILIKIAEDLYFSKRNIEDLEAKLVVFLNKNSEITPLQFKEMTEASRKYTIPLIEYFDRIQTTVRVGDNRVLRRKRN